MRNWPPGCRQASVQGVPVSRERSYAQARGSNEIDAMRDQGGQRVREGVETKPTMPKDDPTPSIRRRLGCPTAVALVLFACGRPPAGPPPPPKVKVVQPVAREITEWDEYTARLDAVDSVEVRPRVSGYLQSIHFQDGAIVQNGDLLFLIDPRPDEAALHRTEADADLAKSRLRR